MAQQAAGSGGNSNNNGQSGDDVSCVFSAVAAGEPVARVSELIEQYACGGGARTRHSYEARRSAAVYYKSSEDGGETPLWSAHERLERGDLVGALLEHGSDAKALGRNCNALALAIHYGQTDTLRALLRSGRHHANERMPYDCGDDVRGCDDYSCLPVHLAVAPPRRSFVSSAAEPPPRIDALEVLAREFAANVNVRCSRGFTPPHWAVVATPGHRQRVVDALVLGLGADLDGEEEGGESGGRGDGGPGSGSTS